MAALLTIALTLIASSATPSTASATNAVISMVKQAFASYEAGDYARAAELYLSAWRADPRPEYLWSLARAYHLAGQHDNALEYYSVFIRSPGDMAAKVPKAHLHIAEIRRVRLADRLREAEKHERAGQPQIAAVVYLELARSNPERHDLIFRAAVALQSAGQDGSAAAAFEDYLRLTASDAPHRNEAEARLQLLKSKAVGAASARPTTSPEPTPSQAAGAHPKHVADSVQPKVPAAVVAHKAVDGREQPLQIRKWAVLGTGVAVFGAGMGLWLTVRPDSQALETALSTKQDGKIIGISREAASAQADSINARNGVAYAAMALGAGAAAAALLFLDEATAKVALVPGPVAASAGVAWRF